MATAACQLSEEQFLCSICLDVFTDPVSLPCGHNFCKDCIEQHWFIDVKCNCPYCKQAFNTKPELRVNIFISEMAAHFRESQLQSSSGSELQDAKPREIFCDFCTDPKKKALKSCLVCLSSYCETHLEPHLSMAILKRHQLTYPQRNPDIRFSPKVPEGMTQRTDAEIQEMIATRQQKIQQLCQFMELNNKDANTEIADSVQTFTALKDSVERDLDILIQEITIKKKTTEDRAKGYIKELEQEISELKTFGKSTDTKDWMNFSLCRPTYEGTGVRAVAHLEKILSQQMGKIFVAELQRVQKHRVYVTLDPDKVHPTSTNQRKSKETDKPECKCVLASHSFSSGKFYFEVVVASRSKWALGVAKELHVGREVALSPRNAYWTICLRNKTELYAGAEPSVRLSLKSNPKKVGVFVDYEEGLVSFYDANNAALIFTFTGCSFTQKLHPFFSPCENDGLQLHTLPESSCVLQ